MYMYNVQVYMNGLHRIQIHVHVNNPLTLTSYIVMKSEGEVNGLCCPCAGVPPRTGRVGLLLFLSPASAPLPMFSQPNNQASKQPSNQTTKQPSSQAAKQPNNQTTKPSKGHSSSYRRPNSMILRQVKRENRALAQSRAPEQI